MSTPTPGAAAELPVFGYVIVEHHVTPDTPMGQAEYNTDTHFDFEPFSGGDNIAVAKHAPAQAQLDALREEVARLKAAAQESALQYLSDNGQWIEEVARLTKERDEATAGEFVASRDLAAACNELAALKAQPSDVDALMALADDYAGENYKAERFGGHYCEDRNTAREALRAKLAARKEEL